jgi:hypothetical protein
MDHNVWGNPLVG